MNKKLRLTLAIVLGLAAVVYIGLTFFLGSIVKAGVNRFGPQLTQTKVVLSGAHISPLTGSGNLSGLAVGNPKGWSDANAFYLGKIHLDVEPFSVLGDHIVINELIIDQPEFLYETKIISSNIKDLLKNIEQFTGSGGREPATKSGQPIKFVVKKFRLTNGTVRLGVGPAALPMPLPPLAMDNIGVAQGGISPDELAGAIMQDVLSGIVQASTQALMKAGSTSGASAAEAVNDAARKTGDSLKKIFGK
ncbi:MAG: hypothetical protein IPN11_01000 [Opitutaceae bacterium]|nr:hypothetical protein [Opitutaceae bacterium]